VTRLRQWWAAVQRTHLYAAWRRYSASRGSVLAGGVGYFAFFSIFPAVLLAFTVFGIVLQNQPDLLEGTKDAINEMLPGFVKSESNPEGVIDVTAPTGAALSISGVLSVTGLVIAGIGWLGAMRDAIRTLFGVEGSGGNAVVAKLRDLGVMAVMGVGIVASALVSALAGTVATWGAGLVGLDDQGWVLTASSLVVGVLLDSALVMFLLRVLAGVDIPWRVLRNAGLFGGVGLTALKKFGTVLLSGTMDNKLFASFALVVGLLVWLNLISRVILVSAAWAANDFDTARGTAALSPGQQRKLLEGPEPGPTTVRDRVDAGLPSFGQAAADRTTLAAGAILGATGALALSGLMRGLRGMVRGPR
jgi:membrane protein